MENRGEECDKSLPMYYLQVYNLVIIHSSCKIVDKMKCNKRLQHKHTRLSKQFVKKREITLNEMYIPTRHNEGKPQYEV